MISPEELKYATDFIISTLKDLRMSKYTIKVYSLHIMAILLLRKCTAGKRGGVGDELRNRRIAATILTDYKENGGTRP